MKKQKTEGNIIIAINAIKKIMKVFLGPFLTAYFIKTSQESIIDLSTYYIFSYILLALGSFIISSIIKNKFRIGMFRIGVIINFFYMLTIIILKQDIIKYLPLLSILYGISTSTYYTPYNLFVMNKIDNEYRTEYTVKSKIVLSLVGILCPILLGSMITITNYENTAWIILIISCIQILLSFILSSEEETKLQNFNLKNTLLKIKGNKQIKKLLIAEYFFGIGSSEGALEVLITILIFNSFKTDFNLGIITSVTTMLSILFVFMYGKIYKTKNDKNIITISSIIPIILVLMLTTYKSDINIIIFNICYVISTTILSLTREIRLYNISNSYIIDKNIQTEFFTIRECILNFGRITGYILLLLVGISTNQFISNIIMITLTLAILITGLNLNKVDRFIYNKKYIES